MSNLLSLALIAPFAGVFARAAQLEYRRWRKHGPSLNRRSHFPIDETAPSYEHPEKTRQMARRRAHSASEIKPGPARPFARRPGRPA